MMRPTAWRRAPPGKFLITMPHPYSALKLHHVGNMSVAHNANPLLKRHPTSVFSVWLAHGRSSSKSRAMGSTTKGHSLPARVVHPRACRLDPDKPHTVVYVLGDPLEAKLNRGAPPGSKFFSVKCTPGVQYHITPPPTETGHLSPMALSDSTMLLISMKAPSEHENDSKLSVKYYGEKKEELGMALLLLTAVDISLDVDADRDGIVEKNNPNKGSWKWGPDGHGAILLVNCDCERTYWKTPDHEDDRITRVSDLKDMSTMVLRTSGPAKLPDGYKLALHVSQGHAESIRVFRPKDNNMSEPNFAQKLLFDKFVKQYPLVLSSEDLSKEVPYLGDGGELKFYVEGLRFPDKDFDGLINIHLSLLEPIAEDIPKTPIFTETVVFRVAPWIMTPNTLRPEEVLVCSTDDNFEFLRGIETVVVKAGCKMRICKEVMNQGDRWMQDELEFGYIDSPHQQFPVVLDSPRDGSLQDFPYTELLGPDFGYVTREVERTDVSSLDSFGNLEVSPPVTVNGKKYPLGRILIGVAFPTATVGRSMTKVVQNFLWAQKVQEPVALYSDWLSVGHIDEFMSFVPAHDKKGFRLLLASPDAGYKLFRGLQKDGHGEAKLFEGVEDEETPKETVDEILKNKSLREQNSYVQSCVDWNRDVLKRELGLEEEDIIDLPILFKLVPGEEINRAVAYYPDMVNMIVLGKNLGIPKPFGPRVNGRCALEAEMCSLMGSLGLSCTFINNFESYHKLMGEVHCGSNVRRKPFDFKWWNMDM